MISKVKAAIKALILSITDRIPSPLPRGATEFDTWVSSILSSYSLPDNPSHRHAVARAVMQLGPTIDSKPRYHFVQVIRRAQAGEVAYSAMRALEETEAKRQEALKAEAQAEADAKAILDKAKAVARGSEEPKASS